MNIDEEKIIQNVLIRHFDKMSNMLLDITTKLEGINERVNNIEEKLKENAYSPDMNAVIPDKIILQDDEAVDIFKNLCSNDIGADMKIFKEYYMTKMVEGEKIKLVCPIKFESYRKFYFWNGKKWIADMDGYYISKTLSDNLQRFYLRHNKTSSADDMEKVFKNQEYINSMKTDKYKRLLIKELRSMINLSY